MSRIKWDETGSRRYRTGTKNGVLYPYDATNQAYNTAFAWNGLTGVSLSPEGAEANEVYADDMQYLNLYSAEKLKFTIEALDCPDEFDACDGLAEITDGVTVGQQERQMFGFSYVTTLGNDVAGNSYGEEIHLLYGCKASPSDQGYETINDSPEPLTLSWECSTTPVAVPNKKPTAHVVINSTKCTQEAFNKIKDVLYGKDASGGQEATVGRLPLPSEIPGLMAAG